MHCMNLHSMQCLCHASSPTILPSMQTHHSIINTSKPVNHPYQPTIRSMPCFTSLPNFLPPMSPMDPLHPSIKLNIPSHSTPSVMLCFHPPSPISPHMPLNWMGGVFAGTVITQQSGNLTPTLFVRFFRSPKFDQIRGVVWVAQAVDLAILWLSLPP